MSWVDEDEVRHCWGCSREVKIHQEPHCIADGDLIVYCRRCVRQGKVSHHIIQGVFYDPTQPESAVDLLSDLAADDP